MVETKISEDFLSSFEYQYDQQNEEMKKITHNTELVRDLTAYIRMQFNPSTVKSYLNDEQYNVVVSNAIDGLFTLLYITHYPEPSKEDLSTRDTLLASASNFIYLISNRIYKGRDRDIDIEEIRSRQPITYMGGAQR